MISYCRLRPCDVSAENWAVGRRREGTTVAEMGTPTAEQAAACLEGGLLPVACGAGDPEWTAAWVVSPEDLGAVETTDGWRVTVRHRGTVEQVLDALARSGAAFLRTGRKHVAEAAALAALPGVAATVSVFVDGVEDAVAAVAAGAGDLLLRDWDTERLGELRQALGGLLVERTAFPVGLTVEQVRPVLPPAVLRTYLAQVDASGAVRPRWDWAPGKDGAPPARHRLSAEWADARWVDGRPRPGFDGIPRSVAEVLERSLEGTRPARGEVEMLFRARGASVEAVAAVADELRRRAVGDVVTYVVNRNINYTNQCYFRCGFCAFSKGPRALRLRGEPYLLEIHEVVHRVREAHERGATEVCLQGGIHPEFTGEFYVAMLESIKAAVPEMHVHGFTPLEVWQGAETLGESISGFLGRLREAGLGSLPGTAAEILDDRVRQHLCPDKITTAEWAYVMETAHDLGLRSTATVMFGHIDDPSSWAEHLEVIRAVQLRTGGFTEFVPLPFVHMGAPIFLRGEARPGPTWDEVVLMHSVARIAFDGLIPNIQASWVKLGLDGAGALLRAGCNDLGGTLMDESISRAAGARHGQQVGPDDLERAARAAGRTPVRRTTLYQPLPRSDPERVL